MAAKTPFPPRQQCTLCERTFRLETMSAAEYRSRGDVHYVASPICAGCAPNVPPFLTWNHRRFTLVWHAP